MSTITTPSHFTVTVRTFRYGPGHLTLTSWAAEPWGTLAPVERIATASLDPVAGQREQAAALAAAHGLQISDEPGRAYGLHEAEYFAYPA